MLLIVGSLCAALGLVAGHVNRHLLDGPTFAEHVDEIRRDPTVAARVGEQIAARIITARPDLVALGPLIEDVAVRVAGGERLAGPTRLAARTAHEALTEEGSDQVVLRIADAGAVVAAVVAQVAPDRAPAAGDVAITLADVGSQAFASTTIAVARVAGVLAWALPLLALALFGTAVVLAGDRWATAMRAGWALAWAALGVAVLLVIGGFAVRRLDADALGGAVAQAAWREMVRPLWWGVAVLGLVGVGLALACGSAAPLVLEAHSRRALAAVRRPATVTGRVLRAGVLAAVGVAAVLDPLGVLEPVVVLGGVALVVTAAAQVAGVAGARRAEAIEPATAPAARERPRAAAWVVGGAAVLLAFAGVVVLAQPSGDLDATDVTGAGEVCNGHAELCDRTFDEVAYVASHNAMSVARAPGWFLAEQLDPIAVQLDQGVRALLVDVWAGSPAGTVVRTAPGSYEEARAVAEAELGPEIVAAAGRIGDSVAGVPLGPEALFLCHGLCETGSTPFLDMLADVRAWMVAHPDEVLTLFIEDHVDPDRIAADVEAAGLADAVHHPALGEAWPTLAEMIRSGRRLVVMLEEGDGGESAPWLVNGFERTQDTPYTFPTVDDFSCDANRGPSDAPLFLLNHWLSGFGSLVSDAELVNVADVLLTRARQCQDERGQISNFVAVNFVTIGDVQQAVDELNGVAA